MKDKINLLVNRYKDSHVRTQQLIKNIVAGFLIKGMSIICIFLLVPITIDFVSVKQYGLWLTISSIIGWASFFDVGLGNGLRNKFAEAIALNQHEQAKHYVSSAYFMLGLILAILAVAFTFINPLLNWATILAAPQEMKQNLSIVASIVVYSFLLQLLFQLINSMLMASQLQNKSALIGLVGNILSLGLIFLATKTIKGDLLVLASIFSILPTLVLIFYNFKYFKGIYKDYIPNLHFVRKSDLSILFGIGSLFFIIQISTIIQFQTANVLIAHWLNYEDVTIYNICFKYFSVLTMAFSLIVAPYWSAFTEAHIKSDFAWIKSLISKTVKLWMLFAIVSVIALVISPLVFKLWVGERVNIPFILSSVMLVYVLLLSFGSIYVMFMNGTGNIRMQTITSIISPFVFFAIAFMLTKNFGLGVVGIVIATILSNFYGPIIAPLQYYKMINK